MSIKLSDIELRIVHMYERHTVQIWLTEHHNIESVANITMEKGQLKQTMFNPMLLMRPKLKPFLELPAPFFETFLNKIQEEASMRGKATVNENLLMGKMQATEKHLDDMRNLSEKLLTYLTDHKK